MAMMDDDELEQLRTKIADLVDLLGDDARILGVAVKEVQAISDRFGM